MSEQVAAPEIPEDLRQLHVAITEAAKEHPSTPYLKPFFGRALINRIAALTLERDTLKAERDVALRKSSRGVWRCFHCDEIFDTPGGARDHFGAVQGDAPGCLLKVQLGDERGWLMELRKEQEANEQQLQRALAAERDVEQLECRVASLSFDMKTIKPFAKCDSMRDVFNVYDSMEGRALAAEEQVAALKAEQNKFLELVCKYQCNPTWKLSTYEAIRNHLETAHRVCNENYDWAKRVEAERDTLKQQLADSDLALDFANKCVGKYMADAEELKAKVERLSAPVSDARRETLELAAEWLRHNKIEHVEREVLLIRPGTITEADKAWADALIAARASTPPTLLVFTCPFDGEVWRFHTQEQLNMLRKHLEWHATNINSKEYPA